MPEMEILSQRVKKIRRNMGMTQNHIPDAAEGWENSTLLLCRLMLTKKTSYVIRYRDDAIQFR